MDGISAPRTPRRHHDLMACPDGYSPSAHGGPSVDIRRLPGHEVGRIRRQVHSHRAVIGDLAQSTARTRAQEVPRLVVVALKRPRYCCESVAACRAEASELALTLKAGAANVPPRNCPPSHRHSSHRQRQHVRKSGKRMQSSEESRRTLTLQEHGTR